MYVYKCSRTPLFSLNCTYLGLEVCWLELLPLDILDLDPPGISSYIGLRSYTHNIGVIGNLPKELSQVTISQVATFQMWYFQTGNFPKGQAFRGTTDCNGGRDKRCGLDWLRAKHCDYNRLQGPITTARTDSGSCRLGN